MSTPGHLPGGMDYTPEEMGLVLRIAAEVDPSMIGHEDPVITAQLHAVMAKARAHLARARVELGT